VQSYGTHSAPVAAWAAWGCRARDRLPAQMLVLFRWRGGSL